MMAKKGDWIVNKKSTLVRKTDVLVFITESNKNLNCKEFQIILQAAKVWHSKRYKHQRVLIFLKNKQGNKQVVDNQLKSSPYQFP